MPFPAPSAAAAPPLVPVATYRLQFNPSFTFRQAQALVPYLRALGIGHVYASPLLTARRGSLHGYDVVDPTSLNPELGGEGGFRAFSARLRAAGMGLLLDIVPNHMCAVGGENRWWDDMLLLGRGSPYASFFDIDWSSQSTGLTGRVLLPVLGERLEVALEAGQLQAFYAEGAFRVRYFEHHWPLTPRSWSTILSAAQQRLRAAGTPGARPAKSAASVGMEAELRAIARGLARMPLPAELSAPLSARRLATLADLRKRLAALVSGHAPLRRALTAELAVLNGTVGQAGSFARLEALLRQQAYRPAHWRVAPEEINYRRFLDINDLAALRTERPDVFAASHACILELIATGDVHGLRVDHPDGLTDPGGYLRRLRRATHRALAVQRKGNAAAGPVQAYIGIEKVLEPKEHRRAGWPVQGGTGYDFMHRINGLLVAGEHARRFRQIYTRQTGMPVEFPALTHACKLQLLQSDLAGSLRRLTVVLARICADTRRGSDFPFVQLQEALCRLIASLPVYRTYIGGRPDGTTREDRHWIGAAARIARARAPHLPKALFDFVSDLLLDPAVVEPAQQAGRALFVTGFQQLSGAAMAKGLEDTAYYRAFPLASLNEVGGDPGHFGVSTAQFHLWQRGRTHSWPHAMSASTTHDTKRSEDTRARMNVLSEMPEDWERAFLRWQGMNTPHKRNANGQPVPEANTEYLLYQTLVGTWPLGGRDDPAWADYLRRIAAYMQKAVREAGLHSSWMAINSDYETALQEFVETLLMRPEGETFRRDVEAFLPPIQRAGLYNSLTQTLVKLTAPGVPDIYQGNELWDFSLVDPDNRRPVDFARRRAMLRALSGHKGAPAKLAAELLAQAQDGRIKLWLIRCALQLRHLRYDLFTAGDYRALPTRGEQAERCVAFGRSHGGQAVVAAAGRCYLPLIRGPGGGLRQPVGAAVWGETLIELGKRLPPGDYRDVFSGRVHRPRSDGGRSCLPLAEVFATWPVALLEHLP